MAVYDRQYRPYEGPLTDRRYRWLAIARHAWGDVRRSRLYLVAILGALVPPVVVGLLIYLRHNLTAMLQLGVQLEDLVPVDAGLFLQLLSIQSGLTYLLALLVGPALVSADLADGALPLLLCRPLRRREYLAGKAALLLVLLSLVTWVPGIVLVGLQAALEGTAWLSANPRVLPAMVVSYWLWIAVVTLLVLAVSALVRRRLAARVLLLALLYVPAALGSALNELLDTAWGSLFGLGQVMEAIWRALFGAGAGGGLGRAVVAPGAGIPAWSAALVLGLVCLACLAVLHLRVRPITVVRG